MHGKQGGSFVLESPKPLAVLADIIAAEIRQVRIPQPA